MHVPLDILLEGGGSRTWIGIAAGNDIIGSATGPSTNPQSVGQTQAEHTLTDLIRDLLGHWPGATLGEVIAAHGAASTPSTARRFADLLGRVCTTLTLSDVTIRVTNDITPLLLIHDPVCVAIAGTGTGYAARHGRLLARASGLEWLLSDEGGGHDLAISGLRAAVRALDGRGPQTALTAAAHAWATADPQTPTADALFDAVYVAHAKPQVATFAERVLAAAEAGDHVAETLVDHAADELAAGVRGVRHAVGLADNAGTLLLSGSLLTGTRVLADRLLSRVGPRLARHAVRHDQNHQRTMRALRRAWRTTPQLITGNTTIPTAALVVAP